VSRRRGSRWVITYDGPINEHPLRDFARHVADFFLMFAGFLWGPMLFWFIFAYFLSLLGGDFKLLLLMGVIGLPAICGFIAGVCVVGSHLDPCSVPPRVCRLRRDRCYVRKCEYNRWWRCVRED